MIGLNVIFPVCFIYRDRKSAGTGIENNYYRTERNWSKPDSLTRPGITWQERHSENYLDQVDLWTRLWGAVLIVS